MHGGVRKYEVHGPEERELYWCLATAVETVLELSAWGTGVTPRDAIENAEENLSGLLFIAGFMRHDD